ncbi:MAG: NADH-quinone oxidoreductase subunit K [Nitrososphaerales archaeon]|nr:NADH-quinone oxidoreductase subunit K [Nitrososphaerales archaeon]
MNELLQLYIPASILLIAMGIYCMAAKRDLIKIVLGIEIMTSGVNLNLIVMGLGSNGVDALAQSMALISMTIGACVAAVALSIIINTFRHYGTTDVRKLRRLRW